MIHYRTPLNSKSFSDIPVDVLKSGIQKYLRHREKDKMIWCMEELFLFGILGQTDTEKKTGKAIVSNLINRIIIMMDEELSFRECEKYLLIRKYLDDFENSERKDISYLRVICEILVEGNLCRRNSYGRSYWCHRLEIEGDEDSNDSDENYFKNFKECFENGNEEWAIWMFKLFKSERKNEKKLFRRSESIYMIWKYLFNLEKVKKDENLKKVLDFKLKEFFKKDRKERFIFLYSSIDLCMYYDGKWDNHWNELYEKKRLHFLENNEIDIENREKIELDDYVIDMHTSIGKKMGRNKEHFKKIGCFVVNENEEYLRKEWKEYYINFTNSSKIDGEKKQKKNYRKREDKTKINQDKNKKKEILNFDFVENKELLEIDENEIKLCCDVVCGNKVMCFEYDGKIYKEGRKSMNYNLDYYVFDMCKELFGINCIGMELRLGKFRIVKKDKSVLSYKDNWKVERTDENVVYAVMNKIGNCEMLIERKNEVVKNPRWLKEYCRIGMVRGIFRVSDFNMRNVLIDGNDELVSIDENDILGKRKDVFGMKNRAILKELKKNEKLFMELLQEIWEVDFDAVEEIVKKFGFDGEKIRENWMNLEEDVRKELNF